MPLPYRPHLIKLARELRNHSTISEVLLWERLKKRQRRGFDFHRQKPIGDYIVDFFSPQLMLAIEIDGDSHRFRQPDDEHRQKALERVGITFLRFGHTQVRFNPDMIAAQIDAWIDAFGKSPAQTDTPRPAATPLKRGSPEFRGSRGFSVSSGPYPDK
jgi:very-short-patch-repair endonuclease